MLFYAFRKLEALVKTLQANQLVIGTTGTTAAAGNHNHAVTAHAASGLAAASNIQALAEALSQRIKALEDAVNP